MIFLGDKLVGWIRTRIETIIKLYKCILNISIIMHFLKYRSIELDAEYNHHTRKEEYPL